MRNIRLRRRKNRMGERNLAWMDTQFPRIPEIPPHRSVSQEGIRVTYGRDNLINSRHPGEPSGQHNLAAGVQDLQPASRTPPSHIDRIVLGTKKNTAVTGGAIKTRASATPRAVSNPATTTDGSHPADESADRSISKSAGRSSFGNTRPASPSGATAATSSRNHGVSVALTRTSIGTEVSKVDKAWTATARADSLSATGTASSRSTTATSGAKRGTLAIMSAARPPGTKNRLRILTRRACGASERPAAPGRPTRPAGCTSGVQK